MAETHLKRKSHGTEKFREREADLEGLDGRAPTASAGASLSRSADHAPSLAASFPVTLTSSFPKITANYPDSHPLLI